jgi:CubicO group peptidase (beta-lactamase class C family)
MKKFLLLPICLFFLAYSNAYSATFPGQEWEQSSPQALSVSQEKVKRLFDLSFQDQATQGVVLIKNGVLIAERYAQGFDSQSPATSWSMAKSFYAALIGISIDRGEIASLDDKVSVYLDYFNDERQAITIRHILDMASGLEMPSHEHEKMFFTRDHLSYAQSVDYERPPGQRFEYNNVNSMLLADILQSATGIPADQLLRDRILSKIGMDKVTLWQDAAGNPMTYCCIDTSPRQYARFGLLFSRSGQWNNDQVISKDYVDETFQLVWDNLTNATIQTGRGYSLHWWISRHNEESQIFNASGKFGQYIFVDRANDIVFVRVTKYHPTGGNQQNWGSLRYIARIGSVDFRRKLAEFLDRIGLIKIEGNVQTPVTFADGISNEFFQQYDTIIDALVDLSKP